MKSAFNWSSGRFNISHWGRIDRLIRKELSYILISSNIEEGRIDCKLLIKVSKIWLNWESNFSCWEHK